MKKAPVRQRLDIPVPKVIVFRPRAWNWYSRVVVAAAYLLWAIGGCVAGWRLVVSAPVWWWQGALAIIWAVLLGVLQWPLWTWVRKR